MFLAYLPTCVCRQRRQIFPVLMTCLTESELVPYKFFSNSPDSISLPGIQEVIEMVIRYELFYKNIFLLFILLYLNTGDRYVVYDAK